MASRRPKLRSRTSSVGARSPSPRKRRLLRAFLLAFVPTTALCGCSRSDSVPHRSSSSVMMSASGPGAKVAQSQEWASQGDRLRADKSLRRGTDPSFASAANSSDFAYQSMPVDVTANGTYWLRFGPMGPAAPPDAYAVDLPSDISFRIEIVSQKVQGTGSAQYLLVQARVVDMTAPYPAFSMWIY